MMEPGPELDHLVAEKVVGSPEPSMSFPADAPPSYFMARNSGQLVSGDGIWRIRHGSDTNVGWDPLHFSREWDAMRLVVEKLQAERFELDICVYAGAESPEASCEISREYPGQWVRVAYETAPTLPHAVCLAALKAVGHE